VTADQLRSLEAVWPELQRRLLSRLNRAGVTPATAEDVVQEVAARIVSADVAYRSVDDLMPWAATVARHLLFDHRRSEARRPTVTLEDAPSPVEFDDLLEHRRRLAAVVTCWSQLSDQDRQALSAPFTGARPTSRAEGVRWAVRRHAARARLAAIVDRTAGRRSA